MKLKCLLTACFIFLFVINSSLFAESSTAKSILRDIDDKGTEITCSELYSDTNEWYELLKGIASGESEWLKIAFSFLNTADAGAREMIHLALGEALEQNPENVLNMAHINELYIICSGPDIDNPRYDSYELSIKAINKRIVKIKAIQEMKIMDKCISCTKYLEESKKGIASFYQIDD